MTFIGLSGILSLVARKQIVSMKCDMRKCRNWQTSKTKDLVTVTSCGFKSHLPHERPEFSGLFSYHGKLLSYDMKTLLHLIWDAVFHAASLICLFMKVLRYG